MVNLNAPVMPSEVPALRERLARAQAAMNATRDATEIKGLLAEVRRIEAMLRDFERWKQVR